MEKKQGQRRGGARTPSADAREYEAALERAKHLDALVEHSADMVETAAMDGLVTYINPAGMELLGWERIPAHATLGDFFPPERRAELLATVRAKQLLDEGWEGEVEFENRRTGEHVPVHAKAFAIRDGDGKAVARAFIARDMRAWKQAQAMLQQADKLAAMGRVAATIAHEINNPLAAAVNLVFLLESEKDLSRRAKQRLRSLRTELDRITAVTRETLDYYRDTRGRAAVPMAEMLSGVVGAYSLRLSEAHIEVKAELDSRIRVTGSLNELRQVMVNLVGNAIEAMSAGGTLRIALQEGKSWDGKREPGALVSVTDTGVGVVGDASRLFEPFYTTKAGGTGLGLWVSQGIVKKHGGTIRYVGGEQRGSRFEVWLPKAGIRGGSTSDGS